MTLPPPAYKSRQIAVDACNVSCAAYTLSHDSNLFRISTELCNILLDPMESQTLVTDTQIERALVR